MPVTRRGATVDSDLWVRVCSDYLELPGLQLTLRQARRLWATDEGLLRRLFDDPVESGFLRRCGDHYGRADASPQTPRDVRGYREHA